ncbi:MAG TPA: tripartite tricarboxylate transporter substrate-binding protein [Xanthobacteraceae bacterium]|jgi:tripartite-type tricarboxylate transporter receptor subunit TctC
MTSKSRSGRVIRAAALLAIVPVLTMMRPAQSQPAADFYKGKQIRWVVGTAAGQDYDLWARLMARHMVRHIPGSPTIIVENMPGAGHILATNYLFNTAAHDGTVVGMVSRNMTDAAVMGLPNVRFDPGRFNWIGSPEVSNRVLFVSPASGIGKVPDLFDHELIVGAPGGAQGVTAAPILLKHLLGMKLKIVQGYHSPNDVVLAIARGEVGGVVNSIGGPESARRQQWVASGELRPLFNMEPEPLPNLGAPTIFDFVRAPEQRQVLTFFSNNVLLGRPLMAPPGVPAERVALLRAAFDATMRDEAFRKEAAAMGFELAPKTGAEIAALVAAALATPRDIVDKAEAASRGD